MHLAANILKTRPKKKSFQRVQLHFATWYLKVTVLLLTACSRRLSPAHSCGRQWNVCVDELDASGKKERENQVTILYMNATSGKRGTSQPLQFCGAGYELWWLFISEPPAAKSKGAPSVAVPLRWGPTA